MTAAITAKTKPPNPIMKASAINGLIKIASNTLKNANNKTVNWKFIAFRPC